FVSIAPTLEVKAKKMPAWLPKDREERHVPLTRAFVDFLRNDYANWRQSDYMIAPDKRKGRWRYRHDFRKAFLTYTRSQGVATTFHDARRTFASLLVSAGVPLYKVARWLGDGIRVVEKHY